MLFEFLVEVFLGLLMKAVGQNDQSSPVKEAEYTKDVTCNLHSDLKQAFCIFNMLKVSLRNSTDSFNKLDGPEYLVTYFSPLGSKELFEMIFVKNNGPVLLLIFHCKDNKSCTKVKQCL